MFSRVIIGIALAIAMFIIIILRGVVLQIGMVIFGVGAAWEMCRALRGKGKRPLLWPVVLFIVLIGPANALYGLGGILALFLASLMLALSMMVFVKDYDMESAMATLTVLFYPGGPILCFMLLNELQPESVGVVALALSVMTPVLSDCMSFFFGKVFGRHKMTDISPKKTWEGYIGGAVTTALGVLAFGWVFHRLGYQDLTMIHYAIIGVIDAFLIPVGDLVASAIKRYAGIKDFSRILGNHGGFLDRLDSIFMSAVVVFVLMTVLRLGV
jgi:phosphatidate cytidylyltransferase